jgi:hypothetical protein
VLKTLNKRYEAFVAESQEAHSVTNLVCVALVNILKSCRASSNLNGDGEDCLGITEEAEENRRAVCQHVDDRDVFHSLSCATEALSYAC